MVLALSIEHHLVLSYLLSQTMQWDKLVAKELPPPWVPPIKDPLDVSNFDNYDEDEYVIEEYKSTGDAWDEDF